MRVFLRLIVLVFVFAFIMVLIVVFLVGCSFRSSSKLIKDNPKSDISSLLNKLEELGYYKYIDESPIKDVMKNSLDAGYVFGWQESGRDFSTDAENLAEGGIAEFYDIIRNFLIKQNVDIVVSEDFTEKGYSITVNGKSYVIYNEEDLNSKNIWEESTVRSFSIINNLLKESDSKERIFMLYGGNDLRAVFLTDEMYTAITESNILDDKELPRPVPDDFR